MNLPEGWVLSEIGELGKIFTGKTPSTKVSENFGGSIPFIKPSDLDHGGYIYSTADTLTELGLKSVPKLPPNSITVTCIGNLGKIGITTTESATNQQINSVVPSQYFNYKFLYYYLATLKSWLEQEASATTVAIINKGKFSKAPIKLAPLAEQHQITDKLDELLAQVDSIKTRLDAIPNILKRFRQSVLAAAVSGKMTEDWRKTEILTDWLKSNIGNISTVATGKTPSRSESLFWNSGTIPWLTSSATNNLLYFQAEQYVTELAVKMCTLKIFPSGTLLLAMYGEGKTRGQVTELKIDATCNQACAAITVNNKIALKQFVKLRLLENYEETRKAASGGNQPNLNLNKVRDIPIFLPPIEEQTEIVRRVEQLFTYADQIEQHVKDAQARVNHLTQAILAKAFRGELTADWRAQNLDLISGENSAEALLVRIQADKSINPKAKRTARS